MYVCIYVCMYVCMYIYIYMYCPGVFTHRRSGVMRCWRNTVEIVQSETSNSINLTHLLVHAHTSRMRPMIGVCEPTYLDEVSNRIPPTAQVI